jgi:hypothetical protein
MSSHSQSRLGLLLGALGGLALLVTVSPAAWGVTQTETDPSDSPAGPQGETDLRTLVWDITASSATLTVSVDESTYGSGVRADLGLHIMLDTDADGLADAEVAAARSADGVAVDVTLRSLSHVASTATCQDLAGNDLASDQVATAISAGLETFAYTFETTVFPEQLARFRWAALGQSPHSAAAAGPWDYLPDGANPDGSATNPGDRQCGPTKGGVVLDLTKGVDFPSATPPVTPPADPTATCPGHATDPRNQVVGTAGPDVLVGTPEGDVLCGLGGDDRIDGRSGADILAGGAGRDRLVGGLGADVADGGSGKDTASGGEGADRLIGGSDRDLLSGKAGDDVLSGGDDADRLVGGEGHDRCRGGAGTDVTRGCES